MKQHAAHAKRAFDKVQGIEFQPTPCAIPQENLSYSFSREKRFRRGHFYPLKQQNTQSLEVLNKKKKSKTMFSHSPCSIPQESLYYSFTKADRFSNFSIYKSNRAKYQSRTNSLNIGLILVKMRKQYQQILNSQKKHRTDQAEAEKHQKKHFRKTGHLTKHFLYDWYGNRIELADQTALNHKARQEDLSKSGLRKKKIQPHFCSASRLNLGLPLNFNPGPGRYNCANFQDDSGQSGAAKQPLKSRQTVTNKNAKPKQPSKDARRETEILTVQQVQE